MDYKTHLLKENSKANWSAMADHIGSNPDRFAKAMTLYLNEEYRITQRVSQVIGKVIDKHPQLIEPYFEVLISSLKSNPIDAVKRNTVRMFQTIPIPEKIEGELFDQCMKFIANPQEAIAIRAFSMTVCRRVAKKYPDLALELIPLIEIALEEDKAPGFQNRGKKELNTLRKL